jgi:hypothetical protein
MVFGQETHETAGRGGFQAKDTLVLVFGQAKDHL